MKIRIGADGVGRFIYSDAGAVLARAVGAVEVKRASHVEPAAGGWAADLGPVGGPVLGPYATRAEALAREVEWLQAAGIPRPQ